MRAVAVLFVLSLVLTTASAVQAARHDAGELTRLAHVDTDAYEVTYVERRVEQTHSGDLDAGASRTYPLNVRYDNLTRVDVILSWTETGDQLGATDADTFRLEVTRPDGAAMDGSPAEGAGGVLVLRSDRLNDVPERRSVTSDELEDVRAERTTEGRGTWRATVTLPDTGGDPAMDEGNTYVLTLVIRHYEVSPLKVISLEPPEGAASVSGVSIWTWTTAGLGVTSVGLGGFLVVDHFRRRTA